MYTGNQFVFIFFIYGLAFFTMGVASLIQNRDKNSSFPLERSVSYLGLFGITHGLTEWIIMLKISNMYPLSGSELLILAAFLNGLSFVFLWIFGIKLLEKNYRIKLSFKVLPWLIFGIWIIGFIIFYFGSNEESVYWVFKEDILSRYFIGFPGAMITSFALYKNANYKKSLKLNYLYLKLKTMSISFLVYGILAGLVVNNIGIFPSTIINRENFYNLFGFPVELVRTIVAIIITLLFLEVIKRFQWETNKKNEELMRYKILNDDRKKIAHELHDVIIQNLFASGLQLENLMENENNPIIVKELENVKENLNITISQVRDFIKEMESMKIQFEDLKFKITGLVENLQSNSDIKINLKYNVAEITLGILSQEKITQVYYIIQEALYNAVKHSHGTEIVVEVSTTVDSVVARIKDNGIGFGSLIDSKENHYGLNIMRERAEKIKGTLNIKSSDKGTLVTVIIPWEVQKHEGKKL